MGGRRDAFVPPARWERWQHNFEARHGATTTEVREGTLCGEAADGSTYVAHLPFDRPWGDDRVEEPPPGEWGVLLVRKGGFAVARLARERLVESKVGQRHVQGRTKAGGQSQQRFARRRANQAQAAYEAATEHAVRVLGPARLLVVGGDREAVAAVLADLRLAGRELAAPFLAVPDPRRAVLEQAVRDSTSVRVHVTNA